MIGPLSLLIAMAASPQGPMVSADPATCNLATATRINLIRLLQHPDRWFGRCVSVTGLWSGRAFYTDMRDALRPRAELRDDSRDRRLGIYASEELFRLQREQPRSFRAVGILLDCERLWDGQIFVSGYCHNNASGPFLAVTEARRSR